MNCYIFSKTPPCVMYCQISMKWNRWLLTWQLKFNRLEQWHAIQSLNVCRLRKPTLKFLWSFDVLIVWLSTKQPRKQSCQPCVTVINGIKRTLRKKSKASATPAKCKPSLAPLGPEKLRATVQTTRLQFKLLENRLQNLQTKIEENGVGVKPLRMTFSK